MNDELRRRRQFLKTASGAGAGMVAGLTFGSAAASSDTPDAETPSKFALHPSP
ncbi:MAG: twin-arginine translocation signal domain-containing protein, partial [Wenzhouxiangellaceae bacterium]